MDVMLYFRERHSRTAETMDDLDPFQVVLGKQPHAVFRPPEIRKQAEFVVIAYGVYGDVHHVRDFLDRILRDRRTGMPRIRLRGVLLRVIGLAFDFKSRGHCLVFREQEMMDGKIRG